MNLELSLSYDGRVLAYLYANTRILGLAVRIDGVLKLIAWSGQQGAGIGASDHHCELRAEVPSNASLVVGIRLDEIPPRPDWLHHGDPWDDMDTVFNHFDDLFRLVDAGLTPLRLHQHSGGKVGLISRELLMPRPEHLPEAVESLEPVAPEIRDLLRKAANFGRRGELRQATQAYREAVSESEHRDDKSGLTQGVYGVWLGLGLLGFREEADRYLAQNASRMILDAKLRDRICAQFAHNAWSSRQSGTGTRWLLSCSDQTLPAVAFRRVLLECLGGDGAMSAYRKHSRALQSLRPEQRWLVDDAVAVSEYAVWGTGTNGRSTLSGLRRLPQLPPPTPRAVSPMWPQRWYWHHIASQEPIDWRRGVETIRELLASEDGGLLIPRWQDSICYVAARARDNAPEEALQLMRLAWLSTSEAQSGAPLIAAGFGVQLLGGVVTEMNDAEAVRSMVRWALCDLQAGASLEESCVELGRRLFPTPLPPGPIIVASDGCLAGAPLHAAYIAAYPNTPHVPAFRWASKLRRSACPAPVTAPLVSIADPHPDDPVYALAGASREVPKDRATVYLRGKEATRTALRSLSEAGLIVLGLHLEALEAQPVPALRFHDGELTADQLAVMNFKGSPSVALSGCTSAPGQTSKGLQYSLFHALQLAGAGYVIGFAGSVDDEEAAALMSLFVERWPSNDPAQVVAEVVLALHQRQDGACSPGTWGLWQVQQ